MKRLFFLYLPLWIGVTYLHMWSWPVILAFFASFPIVYPGVRRLLGLLLALWRQFKQDMWVVLDDSGFGEPVRIFIARFVAILTTKTGRDGGVSFLEVSFTIFAIVLIVRGAPIWPFALLALWIFPRLRGALLSPVRSVVYGIRHPGTVYYQTAEGPDPMPVPKKVEYNG